MPISMRFLDLVKLLITSLTFTHTFFFSHSHIHALLNDFEFLTKNGKIEHPEYSKHIKNLISQYLLVTMATRKIVVSDKIGKIH